MIATNHSTIECADPDLHLVNKSHNGSALRQLEADSELDTSVESIPDRGTDNGCTRSTLPLNGQSTHGYRRSTAHRWRICRYISLSEIIL